MARFVQKKQLELTVESENPSSKDHDGTSAATGWKLCRLFGIGFGLLCVLQAALNISLRIFLYDQTLQIERVCKTVREPDELRNVSDQLFEEGWIYARPSFYYISSSQKSWQESREDCLRRAADLIIIDSQEEQDLIRRISKKMWLGMTDRAEEGTWIWVDGTLPNISYWDPEEPNNNGQGREEDCAEINFREGWNDVACESLNFWICERKVAP